MDSTQNGRAAQFWWEAVPRELRDLPQWVCWTLTSDGRKLPTRADGRGAASSTNPETWTTFGDAAWTLDGASGRFAGIGFVFTEDDPFTGIDFDDCLSPDGTIAEWAEPWIGKFPGAYMEISPSGRGVKLWIRGKLPGSGGSRKIGDGRTGIEVYDRGRYFCLTGRLFGELPSDPLPDHQAAIDELYRWVKDRPERAAPQAEKATHEGRERPAEGNDAERRAVAYLDKIDPAVSGEAGHNQTLKAAMIGPGFDLEPETCFRLLRDNFNSRCVPPWSERELRHKIESAYEREPRRGWLLDADRPKRTTKGANSAPSPEPLRRIDDPAIVAGLIDQDHRAEGGPGLAFHRGEFWTWTGAAWTPISPARMKAVAASAADQYILEANAELEPKARLKASSRYTGDVVTSLSGLALIPDDAPPFWLCDDPPFPAAAVLAFSNGVLNLQSLIDGRGEFLAPTPMLFNSWSLPYDFDPSPPEPVEWPRFLGTLWPDDPDSIRLLRQWFGYVLSGRTDLQKILLMLGPPRSGKGTIARILEATIGAENVAAPTLNGLARPFGLQSLIGKPLGVVADARLSGGPDASAVVERLLSISGEDKQTIDRKNRDHWHGKLPTRIMIASNEAPRLLDASGALPSRFLTLQLRESFLGREDTGLERRILAELPGIFWWSIGGLLDLANSGRFVQPESGLEALAVARDVASPISAFLRERCELAPGREVVTKDLYGAWKSWCEENGRDHPGTAQSLGRDLAAAAPAVRTSSYTTRPGHPKPVRLYLGIGLVDHA